MFPDEEKKSDVKGEVKKPYVRQYPDGVPHGKYKGKYSPIRESVMPFQYKKVLREGTEGPTAEIGSRVSIAWRLKKNGV